MVTGRAARGRAALGRSREGKCAPAAESPPPAASQREDPRPLPRGAVSETSQGRLAGPRPSPARTQPHLWTWAGAAAVFPFGRGWSIRGADGARGQAVPEGGPALSRGDAASPLGAPCPSGGRRVPSAAAGPQPPPPSPPAPSPAHVPSRHASRKADCCSKDPAGLPAQMRVRWLTVGSPLPCLPPSLWGSLEERAPSPGWNQGPPGTAGWGRADPDRVCQ